MKRQLEPDQYGAPSFMNVEKKRPRYATDAAPYGYNLNGTVRKTPRKTLRKKRRLGRRRPLQRRRYGGGGRSGGGSISVIQGK